MLSRNRLLIGFALTLIVVPSFWLASRLQASHSDGFLFVRNKIESSVAVQSEIGHITDVHFPVFSRYSAHYGVGYTRVHLELLAVGNKGDAHFEVDAFEDDRVWQIP
jgi:hypothetical protein